MFRPTRERVAPGRLANAFASQMLTPAMHQQKMKLAALNNAKAVYCYDEMKKFCDNLTNRFPEESYLKLSKSDKAELAKLYFETAEFFLKQMKALKVRSDALCSERTVSDKQKKEESKEEKPKNKKIKNKKTKEENFLDHYQLHHSLIAEYKSYSADLKYSLQAVDNLCLKNKKISGYIKIKDDASTLIDFFDKAHARREEDMVLPLVRPKPTKFHVSKAKKKKEMVVIAHDDFDHLHGDNPLDPAEEIEKNEPERLRRVALSMKRVRELSAQGDDEPKLKFARRPYTADPIRIAEPVSDPERDLRQSELDESVNFLEEVFKSEDNVKIEKGQNKVMAAAARLFLHVHQSDANADVSEKVMAKTTDKMNTAFTLAELVEQEEATTTLRA